MTIASPMYQGQSPSIQSGDGAMLAHDLRGALRGVLGGVLALKAAEVPQAARDQIDRIGAAATSLGFMLDALLPGESPSLGREAQAWVELPRFLRLLRRRWSGEAQQRGQRFVIDVWPGAPGRLAVGLTPLLRAADNLIGNAFRQGRGGDVRFVTRSDDAGGLVFEVFDQHAGPRSDFRATLAETSAHDSGDGLGLRIVQRLCLDMGGAFSLSEGSTAGGAAATLAFPASLCGLEPPASRARPRSDLDGVRVLLAEDNPTNQLVATQMLEALNARVTLTSDGVEALERFDAADFDLVVVDIEMPRLSGLDVIRAIRARADDKAFVPIVALTAYVMREHRNRIAAAGANGLVSKPVTSVEALGEALRIHVAPRRGGVLAEVGEVRPAELLEPVADLAVFDALCAAIGAGMMAELLEKVVADLLQARADLSAALATLDRKPIRGASHILISVAGAVGATRLQACARELNIAAHGEESADLPRDVCRCIAEIDAAVAFARARRQAA